MTWKTWKFLVHEGIEKEIITLGQLSGRKHSKHVLPLVSGAEHLRSDPDSKGSVYTRGCGFRYYQRGVITYPTTGSQAWLGCIPERTVNINSVMNAIPYYIQDQWIISRGVNGPGAGQAACHCPWCWTMTARPSSVICSGWFLHSFS